MAGLGEVAPPFSTTRHAARSTWMHDSFALWMKSKENHLEQIRNSFKESEQQVAVGTATAFPRRPRDAVWVASAQLQWLRKATIGGTLKRSASI